MCTGPHTKLLSLGDSNPVLRCSFAQGCFHFRLVLQAAHTIPGHSTQLSEHVVVVVAVVPHWCHTLRVSTYRAVLTGDGARRTCTPGDLGQSSLPAPRPPPAAAPPPMPPPSFLPAAELRGRVVTPAVPVRFAAAVSAMAMSCACRHCPPLLVSTLSTALPCHSARQLRRVVPASVASSTAQSRSAAGE